MGHGKPNVIDLFCGCGGLSEGFKQAGYSIVAAVEKDSAAARTYAINHPEVILYPQDIRALPTASLALSGRVDVIIGGAPCKPFSPANRRSSPESHPEQPLYQEFLRLVRDTLPIAFVFENVPQIQQMRTARRGMSVADDILHQAKHLGYITFLGVINAASYDVPQERKRIVIVGTKKHAFQVPPVLKPETLITVYDAISDLPEHTYLNRNSPRNFSYDTPPKSNYQAARRTNSQEIIDHFSIDHGSEVLQRFSHIPPGGNWRDVPEKLLAHSSTRNKHSNIYRRLDWAKPAPTITHIRKCLLIHPKFNRTISAREGARLQSFDDTYRFSGSKDQVYQQIADAVPPILARAIAQQLLKVL